MPYTQCRCYKTAIKMPNIFSISTESNFALACLETFRRQARACEPYARYLSYLNVSVEDVNSVEQIPFLPIEFFKSEKIICGGAEPQATFTSSGTTGAETSRHHVADLSLYEQSFTRGFEHFYGDVKSFCVLALLPGYLERPGSSLIYMVERLVKESGHPQSGFYLRNHEDLVKTLCDLREKNQPTILIGVSFALLDLVEGWGNILGCHCGLDPQSPSKREEIPAQGRNDSWLIIMETGGMKGRRRELPREELHGVLCHNFGVSTIHSEYGMTELLSQAYSTGGGKFFAPPWMKVVPRDLNNPFAKAVTGTSGGVNIIDLANQNSCSFIETQDLGKIHGDGGFEILGRMDKSQARGCSMLVL